MIYLDNAATSWPKPEIVYQTLDRFLREKGGNAGHGSHSMAMAAQQAVDETRLLIARFINAEAVERVIFTLNCTDSLNLGLKGPLKPGDHVITSGLEHNAMLRPLNKLAGQGVKVTRLPVSSESGFVPPAELEKAILPTTRMIAFIHASNVNGVVQPVEIYGEIARRHNLVFLVDAAQTAGHIPIDVRKMNIDLLAFSGHKGTFGPPGVGVLYISPRVNPDTLREGGTGSLSGSETQPEQLPSKYESGTLNSLGIAGLGAGIKYILSEGLENITKKEHSLTSRLIEGLKDIPRVRLYISPNNNFQMPVISFNIEGFEPGEAGVVLDQAFDIKVRTGLHCSPAAHHSIGTFPKGTIRLSPGCFNTPQEIEQTLTAIRKLAGSATK